MSETALNPSEDKQKDISSKKEENAPEDQPPEDKQTTSSKIWLPNTNWATSLVNTAKEKTKSTFETMKKDIHEFSDTIQSGANNLATATVKQAQIIQQMIAPTPDEKEEVEAMGPVKDTIAEVDKKREQKTEEEKKGTTTDGIDPDSVAADGGSEGKGASIFGIGWMKQMVETVHKFATEDTTKEEQECTEEIQIGPGGRRTILDQCTLQQIQNSPGTFLRPPQQNIDLYKEWLADFKITEYNGEINMLLGSNPRLREIYADLVPNMVDNNSFWNRYFFKVHLAELDQQIALDKAGVPKLNMDKLGSGAVSSGHSPAPSNGKDDWSMCSSGVTTEAEEIDNGHADEREDASTPRPQREVQKTDEDVDDWEECEEDATTIEEEGTDTAAASSTETCAKAK